jgi:hypothetical protein
MTSRRTPTIVQDEVFPFVLELILLWHFIASFFGVTLWGDATP